MTYFVVYRDHKCLLEPIEHFSSMRDAEWFARDLAKREYIEEGTESDLVIYEEDEIPDYMSW